MRNHQKQEMYSRIGKERSRTQVFILVYPSSRATSSPLQTSKDFHYKRSLRSISNNTTLVPHKHTLLLAVKQPVEPFSSYTNSTKSSLHSSYNHTPYAICNHIVAFKNTMIRPNHTVILLKTDYNEQIRVGTLSSAQYHCYTDSESK